MQGELEAKKEMVNQLQNELNITQIILQQEQSEKMRCEAELDRMRSHEGSLSASLHQIEVEFREAQKRIDDLTREFEKTEAKLVET